MKGGVGGEDKRNKNKSDVRRESPAEKVSIAVVSSRCGAVCRGRLRAAVETAEQQWLQSLPVTEVTRRRQRREPGWPKSTSIQEWTRAGLCTRLEVSNAALPCAGQA